MHIHDTFVLDQGHKVCVQIMHLQMSTLSFLNQSIQIIGVDGLGSFGQANKDLIKCLFIFVALAKIVLKIAVDILHILHNLHVVRVRLHCVLQRFVHSLHITRKLLLQALSETIPLLPHLQLGLKVSEALTD